MVSGLQQSLHHLTKSQIRPRFMTFNNCGERDNITGWPVHCPVSPTWTCLPASSLHLLALSFTSLHLLSHSPKLGCLRIVRILWWVLVSNIMSLMICNKLISISISVIWNMPSCWSWTCFLTKWPVLGCLVWPISGSKFWQRITCLLIASYNALQFETTRWWRRLSVVQGLGALMTQALRKKSFHS